MNRAREAYVEAVGFLNAYRFALEKKQQLVEPGRLGILLRRVWLPVHSLLIEDGYSIAEIEDALLFADPVTDLFGQIDLFVAKAASISFDKKLEASIVLAENFGALVRSAGFSIDEIIGEAGGA